MKKLIRKYYMSSFYILTFIFSMMLLTLHFKFKEIGKYSVSFTQLAPAFAVVFLALVLRDHSSLVEIKKRFFFNSSLGKWVILVIAIPSTSLIISGLVLSAFNFKLVRWEGNTGFYLLNSIAILIGCIAEEIGWRGFLLPNLQKKYSPLVSSLIVGLMWGIWHLNFMDGLLGFVIYTITIIEMSILMTWVFNKSDENLYLMVLWHFIFNLTSHLLLWERFNLRLYVVEGIVFGLIILVLRITKKEDFVNIRIREGV
ncbi:MAG: type II CAAX endopeptidase family protein [Clostridiaceae bacterium]